MKDGMISKARSATYSITARLLRSPHSTRASQGVASELDPIALRVELCPLPNDSGQPPARHRFGRVTTSSRSREQSDTVITSLHYYLVN